MLHYILFSGHRTDRPGRVPARFPASKSSAAAAAIRKMLEKILTHTPAHELRGIAAAADGGDILFHEACKDLGIPSELYLAIPIMQFAKTSVDAQWQERYHQLTTTLPVHILHPEFTAATDTTTNTAEATAHPATIWEEANSWMLDTTLSASDSRLTLIALWDGNKGETGGTAHMIHVATAYHATIGIIDTHSL